MKAAAASSTVSTDASPLDLSTVAIGGGALGSDFHEKKAEIAALLSTPENRQKLLDKVLPLKRDSELKASLLGDLDSCTALAFLTGKLKGGALEFPKQLDAVKATTVVKILRGVDPKTKEPVKLLSILAEYGGRFEHLSLFADRFLGNGENIFQRVPELKVRIIKSEDKASREIGRVKGETGRLLKGRVFQIFDPLETNSPGFINGSVLTHRLLLSFKEDRRDEKQSDDLEMQESLSEALVIGERISSRKKRSQGGESVSGEVRSLEKYREALEQEVLRLKSLVDSLPTADANTGESSLARSIPCLKLVTQGRGTIWRWFSERQKEGLLPEAIEHAYINTKVAGRFLAEEDRALYKAALFAYYQQNTTVSASLLAPAMRDLEAMIASSKRDAQKATLKSQLDSLRDLAAKGEITLVEYATSEATAATNRFRADKNREVYSRYREEIENLPIELTELFIETNAEGSPVVREDSISDSLPLTRIRQTRIGQKLLREESKDKDDRFAVLSDSELRALRDLILLQAISPSGAEDNNKFFTALETSRFKEMISTAVVGIRKYNYFASQDFNPEKALRFSLGSKTLDLITPEDFEASLTTKNSIDLSKVRSAISGVWFSSEAFPSSLVQTKLHTLINAGLFPDLTNRKGLQSFPSGASDSLKYLRKLSELIPASTTTLMIGDSELKLSQVIGELQIFAEEASSIFEISIQGHDFLFGKPIPHFGILFNGGAPTRDISSVADVNERLMVSNSVAEELASALTHARSIILSLPEERSGALDRAADKKVGFLIMPRPDNPTRFSPISLGDLRLRATSVINLTTGRRLSQLRTLCGESATRIAQQLEELNLINLRNPELFQNHGVTFEQWMDKHATVCSLMQTNSEAKRAAPISVIEPAYALQLRAGEVFVPKSYFDYIINYNPEGIKLPDALIGISLFRYSSSDSTVMVSRGNHKDSSISHLLNSARGREYLKFIAGRSSSAPTAVKAQDMKIAGLALDFYAETQNKGVFIDWLLAKEAK